MCQGTHSYLVTNSVQPAFLQLQAWACSLRLAAGQEAGQLEQKAAVRRGLSEHLLQVKMNSYPTCDLARYH
jgi:hypothetical protein